VLLVGVQEPTQRVEALHCQRLAALALQHRVGRVEDGVSGVNNRRARLRSTNLASFIGVGERGVVTLPQDIRVEEGSGSVGH
jgi:hypothetical protein